MQCLLRHFHIQHHKSSQPSFGHGFTKTLISKVVDESFALKPLSSMSSNLCPSRPVLTHITCKSSPHSLLLDSLCVVLFHHCLIFNCSFGSIITVVYSSVSQQSYFRS